MKNNTTFSDAEIQGIMDMTEAEYGEYSLKEKGALNLASTVDKFKFNDAEDKLFAFEYAARLRCTTSEYINQSVPFNKRNDYRKKQYVTLEAQVVRVRNAMYPKDIVKKELYDIDDEELSKKTDYVLSELKIEMEQRQNNKKMNEIHESTLIRKKRLGL